VCLGFVVDLGEMAGKIAYEVVVEIFP